MTAYELRTLEEFEHACDQALALAAPTTTDDGQDPAKTIGIGGWVSLVGLVVVLILVGTAVLPVAA